jgi:exonuclease III
MKLIQINIEGDKHILKVRDFLLKENPDVVCIQEIFLKNLEEFKSFLKMDFVYAAMHIKDEDEQGIAIFSKNQVLNHKIEYYYKSEEGTYVQKRDMKLWNMKYALLNAEIDGSQNFQITNTHFPVHYPGSEVSEFQKSCFKDMNKLLKTREELILCADTNCPRGTELWDTLASDYKDNIPADVTTTIDGNLHKAGPMSYVIDCLSTSPHYIAENVRLVDGVSDHMAVVAKISRSDF